MENKPNTKIVIKKNIVIILIKKIYYLGKIKSYVSMEKLKNKIYHDGEKT